MKGKSLSLFGAALTLALTTNVAVAQSSKSAVDESTSSSAGSPTEIKMSAEGFKVLCERFPLNSRCPGGTPLSPAASGGTTMPESKSFEGGNTPSKLTPAPDAGAPSNLTPVPTTPAPDAGAPSKLTPAPETPAPDAGTPSKLTPAPETPTPDTGAPSKLTPVPGSNTGN